MNHKEIIENKAKDIIRSFAKFHGYDPEKALQEEKVLFWDICVALDDAFQRGKESMRERAAKEAEEFFMSPDTKNYFVAQGIAEEIRSLPIGESK